ncbi:DNA polymerase V subunit UmuC, partial [Lamprobacter modestohalophilus]|nr:DNA polymerase V subunit UmuC [Lamprobacter modestohalophilus]
TLSPNKQQIRCSRSFGATVSSLAELTEAITSFTSRAAEKLRAQQGEAAAIMVEIRSSNFRGDASPYAASRVVPLAAPTADTRTLVAAARAGLQRIYKPGPSYAKAGVILLDLTRAAERQPDLFADPSADDRSQA